MIGFATLDETRLLGAPVIRLYRLAMGRDPDPEALDLCADRLRKGAPLVSLAEHLAGCKEFQQTHGPGTRADAAFIATLAGHVPDGDFDAACRALDITAMTRTELLAALVIQPGLRRCIPLLPGLAPGAPVGDQTAYQLWIAEYDTAGRPPSEPSPACQGPLITLAMAAGDFELAAVERSLGSLQQQVYPHWEMVLAHRRLSPWPRRRLQELTRSESRLRLAELAQTGTNAGLLAHALSQRQGAWAGLIAPGDMLAPMALYEIVAALSASPQARMIFTDEDQMMDGVRTQPRLKPAYSPESMLRGNTIGQLALFDTGLLDAVGGVRQETSPCHLWDLARRSAEMAGMAHTCHLPTILFHRGGPIDPDPPSHAQGGRPPTRGAVPSVSVIVPTRDHAALLSACAEGVLARTPYPDLELLIADNGSTEPAALHVLRGLEADPRVRILRHEGPFNYAAINNGAAAAARGDVLVLLNDDTDVLEPEWLTKLVELATRDDVGAVGAKLLYPDGTIQHAGLLLGPGARATHVARGARADDPGYLGQQACARDLSAVTGACLATRAAVWRAVGGMDERLAVAWNDVDFCLRARAAGLRVVWTPEAVLLHHESASRGREAQDPAQLARFEAERAIVHARWGKALEDDPFLNANLLAEPSGRLVLTMPRRQPWLMTSHLA